MLIISSCSKEGIKLKENDYLIFGHFYGLCVGDQCVQTYKLTENKLYKDFRDRFKDTEPDFRPLGKDKFELVKDLIDDVPRKLLKSDNERFGCPDCADQGGLLIKVSKKGKVESWTIDQRKSDVPEYLHDFMDAVNQAIDLINN